MSPVTLGTAPDRPTASRAKALNARIDVIVRRGTAEGSLFIEPARGRTPTHTLAVTPADVYLVLQYADPALDASGAELPDQPAAALVRRHIAPSLARAHRLASVCSRAEMVLAAPDAAGTLRPVRWSSRLRRLR